MRRNKAQPKPMSTRYQVFETDEYGVHVYKVWDTELHVYVFGTCEQEWAWQECNRFNNMVS
jgi:hypothetical protein